MSTSSARPSDLEAWASASRRLDEPAAARRDTLVRLHNEFTSSLGWGHFDASSMLNGFGTWLRWNETDARWVETIARAFRQADAGTIPDAVILANLRAMGLDTHRTAVRFNDPIALGEPPTSGYADDPVNTASGNFVEAETDLAANGLTRLLRFVRTYNSRSDEDGPFGPGWASWASTRLRAESDGAHWEAPDGQRAVIPRVRASADGPTDDGSADDGSSGDGSAPTAGDAGGYARLLGIPGLVVRSGDGLAIEWFGGGRVVFDRAGLPVLAEDGPGTGVRFTHEGDRLVGMTHAGGKSLTLEWDAEGRRITGVRCSDGRAVTYCYDDGGRLVEAEGPGGLRRYEVDDRSRVVAVIDADGVVELRNTYDDEGGVVAQLSPHGRRSRFRYLPGRVTIVDDDSGGPTNTYVHDEHGQLIGVIDGHGAELIKAYDRWGNPTAVTERNGATTIQEWNDRARLVRRVGPDGTAFEFAYDELDRVVAVTASTGAVTRYRYEGDERTPVEIVDPEGGVSRLTVEGGLVRRVADPDGVEVRFGFDADGNLTSVTDAAGNTGVVERDAAGRVVATVSPTGLRTELLYDARGQLVERRDPGGAVWRFEWTAAGRLAATVDPTGARTEVRYGANGEAEQTVDALGHVTTNRFDAVGNLVGVVLPDGAKWEFTYDGLCRLTGVHDPAGASWLREYDETGNLVGTVDPVGVHRTTAVDSSGRVTGVDDGLTSVGFELDELGRATVHRRADGTELRATYDRCGRITSVTDPLGGVTRYDHTPAGRLAGLTSPMGATTRYERDECGRPVAVVDPLGHRWSYRYDGDGRVTQVVAPTGEIERYRYDDAGRLAAVVSPSGGTTRYQYDAVGRVVAVTDPTGGVRRFHWDPRGQLAEAVDPNGGTTRYERDARGFLRTLVDPLGGRVEHRYDEVGRLVARTDQLGRTTEWEYDPAGRLVRRLLPTGERVRIWYDEAGQVREFGPDEPVVRLERDVAGRPIVVDEPGLRYELDWDAAGRLVAKRRGHLGLAWRYDADGRAIATALPDGTETTYEYDRAGRMVTAAHQALGDVRFEHDSAGRVVALSSPVGHERWRYRDGLLAAHELERAGQLRVTDLERDAAGRVVAAVTDGVRQTYAYDAGGLLVGADGPAGAQSFRYDVAGRLVAETGPHGEIAYGYDAAHQLQERRAGDGITAFRYDAAGRRVAEGPADGQMRTLSWDWLDRLSGIDGTPLAVDAFGDLTEIGARTLLWDPATSVPQLRWFDGTSFVGAERPWATVAPGGGVEWLDRDWQGSVRPPGAGADPWGAVAGDLSPTAAGLGYRGELGLGGLVWLRHRVYDPGTRAFLSVDPLAGVPGDPFSANPYHYAGHDPVGSVDPLGLRPMTEADLASYREAASGNMFERAGDWVGENWEYIAAGALIVGGVLVMATGVGGPIGAAMIGGALLSGGISAGTQRAMTGQVNWGQVGVDMAIGALGGGAGAAVTSTTTVARGVTTTIGRGVIAGAGEGLVSGAAYQGINYARTGQFDVTAMARDTLIGGVTGGGGAYVQERAVLGPLRRTGPDTFESRNTGLVYGPDNGPSPFANRADHVLAHTADDLSKNKHGVFTGWNPRTATPGDPNNPFAVTDEAFQRSQSPGSGATHGPVVQTSQGPKQATTVPMGRDVGYVGGQNGAAAGNPPADHMRYAVRNGNEVITSFPANP